HDRNDPGRGAEPDELAQLPLPDEKQAERRAEEGGTYWALRERREPEERERRRGVGPPSLEPPAIGGAERQGKQQDEERVRPCDPGLPEEGVTRGEDDPSQH